MEIISYPLSLCFGNFFTVRVLFLPRLAKILIIYCINLDKSKYIVYKSASRGKNSTRPVKKFPKLKLRGYDIFSMQTTQFKSISYSSDIIKSNKKQISKSNISKTAVIFEKNDKSESFLDFYLVNNYVCLKIML